MSKKLCNFVLLFLVLLPFASLKAFAGDIPESFMAGEQKAQFVGEITAIDNDTITITPSTVMMGSVEQSTVQISMFDKYHGTSDKPQTGDFIAAVLLDDDKIDDTWVFKCTSDDYKSLKLIGKQDELTIRYEEYINDGEYFEAQKRLDEKAKKQAALTNASGQNPQSKEDNDKVQAYTANLIYVAVAILLVAFVIFVTVTIYKKRHRN